MPSRYFLGALLVGTAMLGSGCPDNKTNLAVPATSSTTSTNLEIRLTGFVIDSSANNNVDSTYANTGIPNATVQLEIAPGETISTSTISDSTGTSNGGFSLRGYFPTEPRMMRIIVSHPSYATETFAVFIPAIAREGQGTSQIHTVNCGKLRMHPPQNFKILTTLDGKPQSGVKVYAYDTNQSSRFTNLFDSQHHYIIDPSDTLEFETFTQEFDGRFQEDSTRAFYNPEPTPLVTTDGNGEATFPGLNANDFYVLVAPGQDLTGDGYLEYFTTTIGTFPQFVTQPATIALQSIPARTITPQILSTNLQYFNDSSYSLNSAPIVDTPTSTLSDDNTASGFADFNGTDQYTTSPTAPVVCVFNYPVQVIQGGSQSASSPRFTYIDNLIDPRTAPQTTPVRRSIGASVSKAANGAIWSFTPNSALPSNEVVALEFTARDLNDSSNNNNFDLTFYVPPTSGLTSSTLPNLDNYNGTTATLTANSVGGTGGHQVYIQFPEFVTGFYQVLQIQSGTGTATIFDNPSRQSIPNGSDFVFSDGSARSDGSNPNGSATAATSGIFMRTPLRNGVGTLVTLPDNTTAEPQTVRVHWSVQNAKGTRTEGTADITVK